MTFSDLELARRLEGAEGAGCREFAEARQRVSPETGASWVTCAGATVVFDGVESPITQTFGIGVFEPLTASALDEIEVFFAERGAPVMHEVSPFAGTEALALLCERGYRPMELSSVMHRPVEACSGGLAEGIQVRVAGEEENAVWADVSARGWASEHPELVDVIRAFGELSSGRRNSVSFLAEVDGELGRSGWAFDLRWGCSFCGSGYGARVPEAWIAGGFTAGSDGLCNGARVRPGDDGGGDREPVAKECGATGISDCVYADEVAFGVSDSIFSGAPGRMRGFSRFAQKDKSLG